MDAAREAELRWELHKLTEEADELEHRAVQKRRGADQVRETLQRVRSNAARTAAFHAAGGNLLLGLANDSIVAIFCALGATADMHSMGVACTRLYSIQEEAARCAVENCSEQERGWVSWCSSFTWLRKMREVEMLRDPAAFSQAAPSITLSTGGSLARGNQSAGWRMAKSRVVMRSGRHFARFTLHYGEMHSNQVFLGVIRPHYDPVEQRAAWMGSSSESDDEETNNQDSNDRCFYCTGLGWHYPYSDWEGRESAKEQGDCVGLLLDLDQGSMTVYKNAVRLGVMQVSGLSGEYCWAVEMATQGNAVRIESAPAPESPAALELTAAAAWIEANPIPKDSSGDDY